MSTITTIQGSDQVNESRETINENFANLNTDKLEKESGAVTGNLVEFGADNELEDSGVDVSDLATAANLSAHTGNTSNPHSVTKSQVGLGNVQNYDIASQAEAEAGSVNNKHMTPLRVAQAIAALATASFSPAFRFNTIFETSGRFSTTLVNGTATFGNNGLQLTTTTTANRSAQVVADIPGAASLNSPFLASPMVSVGFQISGSSVGTTFMGIGAVGVNGTGHTYTDPHIGFKTVNVAGVVSLYATQADGTEVASSALTTIAATDLVEVAFKVNGTTSVDYYWRKNGGNWSAATNLTGHIPITTSTNIMCLSTSNNNTASTDNIIRFISYNYER